MQKSLLLPQFLWIIIFLSSDCSFRDQSFHQNTNESRQVISEVIKQDEDTVNDFKKGVEDYFKDFNKVIPPKLGLAPMRKSVQRNEFEVRLWINMGMPGNEKLLIIHSGGGDNHAYFITYEKTP